MNFLPMKVIVALGAALLLAQESGAEQDSFRELTEPFLKQHCIRCHGPDMQEADLRLDTLDLEGRGIESLRIWLLMRSKLAASEMPPSDEPQPSQKQREAVLGWLTSEIERGRRTVMAPSPPFRGNEVEHNLLFDETVAQLPAASPQRRWRISSQIYYRLLTQVDPVLWGPWKREVEFKTVPEFGGTINEFNVAYSDPFAVGGEGFTYYSGDFGIDKTTAEVLVRNAQTLAEHQTRYHLDDQGRPKRGHHRNLVGPKYIYDANEDGDPLLNLLDPDKELNAERIEAGVREQFQILLLRKPTQGELERFAGLMQKNVDAAGREEGVRSTLAAVALLPEVYFRSEQGQGDVDKHGRRMLSPRELAFAIAFALTDVRPDADLLKAADEARLGSRAEVESQVRRLLDDDAIDKPRILWFFRQYFGYIKTIEAFKDNKTISDFSRQFGVKDGNSKQFRYVPAAFVSDTDNLVRHVLKADRNVLQELLTTNRTFVNWNDEEPKRRMPKHEFAGYSWIESSYNLSEWPGNNQPVELPAAERAGVLTQPSWLIAYSFNDRTDPIHRGLWVRRNLLGQNLPPVPLDVNATIPPDPKKTMREKIAISQEKRCWQCHQRMNPLGLPFEMYDHFGRFRTEELARQVDTSGSIELSGDPSLDGSVDHGIDLIKKLAKSKRVRQVFVRHAFRYWMGRAETPADAPTLIAADRAYVESGGSMKALITALLTSDSFLYRVPAGHVFAAAQPQKEGSTP